MTESYYEGYNNWNVLHLLRLKVIMMVIITKIYYVYGDWKLLGCIW